MFVLVDYWSGHGLQIRAIHIRTILHIRAIGFAKPRYPDKDYFAYPSDRV